MSSEIRHYVCAEWEEAFVAGHGDTASRLGELAEGLPPKALADLAIRRNLHALGGRA